MTGILTAYLLSAFLTAFQPQDTSAVQGAAPADSAGRLQARIDSLENVYRGMGIWDVDTATITELDSTCLAMYDSLQSRLPDTTDIKRAKRRILKAYKDSVRIATPRIIESFVLPDSLKYLRTIAWTADMNFNEVKFQDVEQQKKYNYHYFDYPFYKKDVNANYLGPVGSAAQLHDYFKRKSTWTFDAADPLLPYSYTPDDIPNYNTKTPYTELAYWGTPFALHDKEELECKLLTTQNITPAFNFCFAFEKYGSRGMLKNEDTDNRTLRVNLNYLGKKYLMHAGYIQQRVMRSENGGMRETKWITDTVVDPKEIAVMLTNASSNFARRTFFINHNLAIPMNFFRKDKDSLSTGQGTTAYIGHNMEITRYKRAYYDVIQQSDQVARDMYFNKFYHSATTSSDSIALTDINNKVFLKLQPFDRDAVLSKIDAGVGYRFRSYYLFDRSQYYSGLRNTHLSDFYVYAGASGQYRKYLSWEADGRLNLIGYGAGDFTLGGTLKLSFYPLEGGMHLTAKARISSEKPNLLEQRINFNHHQWDNDFAKTTETRIEGEFSIPDWKLKASVGYSLTGNAVYYDAESMVRQATQAVSVLNVGLEKNFKLGIVRLDHRLLMQFSSDKEVVPLPLFSANLRYYLEFTVVKDAMDMQIGFNGTYYTKYYVPGYMPDLGVFYNQREEELGGNPYIDIFVNCQWKRVCVFLKYTNLFMGWPGKDHFSAYRYIRPEGTIKLGIFWPF